MYIMARDSLLDKLHCTHKNLDKDFDTSIRYMHDLRYNRNLLYTRDDSLRMDCLYNPIDMCKNQHRLIRDISH